jgi:hypothetical protein
MTNMFDAGLARREANYVPLTPIDFIARAADVYGDRLAVVHRDMNGDVRRTWRETHERTRRLASALQRAGIGNGDTVAALLPNIPPMIEAHFGVPMAGAVLNTLNTRLDAASILYMLRHGEARALIVDTGYGGLARRVAEEHRNRGRAVSSSRCVGGGRGRDAGREMGRSAVCIRRTERGHGRECRRYRRALPPIAGGIQIAESRILWRITENIDGQDSEIRIARAGEVIECHF